VGGIVKQSLFRVVAVEIHHVVIPAGDGSLLIAGHVIQVEMGVTVLFAAEHEMLSVGQEKQVIKVIFGDVILIFLSIQAGGAAHPGVCQQNLQLVLVAIQFQDRQFLRVCCPLDPGNVVILPLAQLHGGGDAVFDVVHVYAHLGIGLSGFRVFIRVIRGIEGIGFDGRALSLEKIHGILLHGRFIEFHESDGRTVRCPGKGFVESEFLLVHPIRCPVDDLVEFPVERDLQFGTETKIRDKKIVIPYEGNFRAVWREGGQSLRPARGKRFQLFVLEVKHVIICRERVAINRGHVRANQDSAFVRTERVILNTGHGFISRIIQIQ